MPTRLQLERWGPLIVGVLAVASWVICDGRFSAYFAKELLASLVSAAAIAAGFLTTALSILLPFGASDAGKRLRNSGYLPDLHRYLRQAIFSCLFLTGVCVATFFTLAVDKDVHFLLSSLVVFMSGYSAAALGRVAEVLMNLFERANESDDRDG